MILANDFCLNISKVKEIIEAVDILTMPKGKKEPEWKYDRAYSQLLPLIMNI